MEGQAIDWVDHSRWQSRQHAALALVLLSSLCTGAVGVEYSTHKTSTHMPCCCCTTAATE